MKIAIAQLNPTIGDLNNNAQNIILTAQKAQELGARLLLTPELSLCGYPPRDLLLNHGFIEMMQTVLEQLASQLPANLAVLVGTVQPNTKGYIMGEKSLFNSTVWLENGQIKQYFHKRLLPTYDVFDEHRYFAPGLKSEFFILDQVKIGVTICEDLWNDQEFWGKRSYTVNPVEDLASLGVDLVVNLSASPYTIKKQELREAMLKHTVNKYHLPIIYTNQVGGNDDLIFDGNSFAVNKQADIICRSQDFATDLVILEFDSNSQDLIPSTPLKTQEINEQEELWKALVLGVKDYARKCGFTKAILGLSGGIDSSLVAAIASSALGKENVLGVLMPSPYSSDHSITDALKLAENLGIKTETLPIGNLMTNYDQNLEKLFAGTTFGIAEENIQSRIRGNLLMAIANKFGYLLLSTGNKSEMAVGYCTLYGDMNGGLAVIADVPKTKVYTLCNWLNKTAEIIPNNVIIKPPSAELKPGQKDQDSLPDYDILDDIIERLINKHQSPSEIIASGHDQETVNKILKLLKIAEFKRRQAPPGLKITDRAFGTGWRMPIASKWELK
jgi:NAD+ synthase (glutamine-hydrolysing)